MTDERLFSVAGPRAWNTLWPSCIAFEFSWCGFGNCWRHICLTDAEARRMIFRL